MPMLISGSERIVIENVSTEGPLTFTDPIPHALIERCHIWVRPFTKPIMETGGLEYGLRFPLFLDRS